MQKSVFVARLRYVFMTALTTAVVADGANGEQAFIADAAGTIYPIPTRAPS